METPASQLQTPGQRPGGPKAISYQQNIVSKNSVFPRFNVSNRKEKIMSGQKYLSEVLVDFALKYYNLDLPDNVMEMLPKLLIDKIGLILAGSQFPWSEGT
jgi:hypothetical protein